MTTEKDVKNTPISELPEYASYTVAELERVIEAKATLKAQEMFVKRHVESLIESQDKEANDEQSA